MDFNPKGSLFDPQQQRVNVQEQANYLSGLSFPPDDLQRIMMGTMGSIMPSRNSIVRFAANPQAMLSIGNSDSIFDISGSIDTRKHPTCSSYWNAQQLQRKLQADSQSSQDGTFPNKIMQTQQPKHDQTEKSTQQVPYGIMVTSSDFASINGSSDRHGIDASRTSSTHSKAFTFSLPDTFTAPIDDDLFNDLLPIPLKRKHRDIQPATASSATASSFTITKIEPSSSSAPSLLHQACFLYPTTATVVNSALGVEKCNVRRRVFTPPASMASAPSDSNGSNKRQRKQLSFSLPLHIAIDKGGSLDVVEALVEAGPDVIAMKDGPDDCNAVSLALYKRCSIAIINLLVKTTPGAVEIVDRHSNTCLHVACGQGASLETVKLLIATYPEALSKQNFHGQKPLDVAQRICRCPIEVIDYLQKLMLDSLEKGASHLDDSEDDGKL